MMLHLGKLLKNTPSSLEDSSRIKNLIKNYPINFKKLKIKGLAIDSRDVKKGFIFFAIKGNKLNGENYINKAIQNGAILIICAESCKFYNSEINIIKTKKIRNYVSEIASKFYKLKPKNIIVVTGTNGKTSVAEFFYQLLMIYKINNLIIDSISLFYIIIK